MSNLSLLSIARRPRNDFLAATLLLAALAPAGPAGATGLREAMVEMEESLERLTAAVFRRELGQVEAAAAALADAPRPDLGYRLWLLGRLGEDAPRFRRYGEALTAAAEDLARKARAGQKAQLDPAYREVLDQCLGCHRAFQTRLGEDRQ